MDLVVTGLDGRVVGLEVKLSREVEDRDVRHLHWLRGSWATTLPTWGC